MNQEKLHPRFNSTPGSKPYNGVIDCFVKVGVVYKC